MVMRNSDRAVFQTLLTSVTRNLNATLTPKDCSIVLKMIRDGLYQNSRKTGLKFNDVVESATEVIGDLAGELSNIRKILDPHGGDGKD